MRSTPVTNPERADADKKLIWQIPGLISIDKHPQAHGLCLPNGSSDAECVEGPSAGTVCDIGPNAAACGGGAAG